MSIPYRTRRRLNRLGTVLLVLLLIACLAWLCWVIWLQRYVVYSDDKAYLNFDLSANEVSGQVARPPEAAKNISCLLRQNIRNIWSRQKLFFMYRIISIISLPA